MRMDVIKKDNFVIMLALLLYALSTLRNTRVLRRYLMGRANEPVHSKT